MTLSPPSCPSSDYPATNHDRQHPSPLPFWSILGMITIAAVALRVMGIHFGLPLLLHEDEPIYYDYALRMGLGEWPTDYFKKPGFFLYFYGLFYYLGFLVSPFTQWKDYIAAFWENPSYVVTIGRCISVLLAGGTIWQVGTLGKRLFGWAAGLSAALWFAFDPTHSFISPVVIADIPALFFIVSSAKLALDVYDQGRKRDYLFCALLIALSISFKYNFLTSLLLIAAHTAGRWKDTPSQQTLFRRIRQVAFYPRFGITLLLIPILFFCLNPLSILHFPQFLQDLDLEKKHMLLKWIDAPRQAWYPMIAFPAIFFRVLPKSLDWPVYFLGLAGTIWILIQGSCRQKILWFFPLSFLLLVLQFQLINAKYLLPITVFWYLAAAAMLWRLTRFIHPYSVSPRIRLIVFSLVSVSIASPGASQSIQTRLLTLHPDTRQVAAGILQNSSAPGDLVLMEPGTLTLDPRVVRHNWHSQRLLANHSWQQDFTVETREWHIHQGNLTPFRFIVVNLGIADKIRHPKPGTPTYKMPFTEAYYHSLKQQYRVKKLITPYPLPQPTETWQCAWARLDVGSYYEEIQRSRGQRDMPGPTLLVLERI